MTDGINWNNVKRKRHFAWNGLTEIKAECKKMHHHTTSSCRADGKYSSTALADPDCPSIETKSVRCTRLTPAVYLQLFFYHNWCYFKRNFLCLIITLSTDHLHLQACFTWCCVWQQENSAFYLVDNDTTLFFVIPCIIIYLKYFCLIKV